MRPLGCCKCTHAATLWDWVFCDNGAETPMPHCLARRYDRYRHRWGVRTTGVQVRPRRLLLWLQGHRCRSEADGSHELPGEESKKEIGLDLWANCWGKDEAASELHVIQPFWVVSVLPLSSWVSHTCVLQCCTVRFGRMVEIVAATGLKPAGIVWLHGGALRWRLTLRKLNPFLIIPAPSDGNLLPVHCSVHRLQAFWAGGGRHHNSGAKVQVNKN